MFAKTAKTYKGLHLWKWNQHFLTFWII